MRFFNNFSLKEDLEYRDDELKVLISQFEQSNNSFPNKYVPISSSTGRIFDSVSYLLKASNIKTYGGEPAMRLEGLASNGNSEKIALEIKFSKINGVYIINTSQLILDIIDLLENPKNKKEDIATKFQKEFGNCFAKVAVKLAKDQKIEKIGLTGGVAYNYEFSKSIKAYIIKEGLTFLEHDLIPPGDAGISIGQLIGGYFKLIN